MMKHSIQKSFAVGVALLMSLSAQAEEAIKIGGLFDLSGKAQQIGAPTKEVAQMMVDRLNKNGGLNGRQIELIVADTQSEPSQAVVALKRLLGKDKVVAVIGPTTTGAAMACMNAIEEAGIPMVACVGGDAPVNPARKWVFKTPQRTSTAVERLYAHLKEKGLTKIGVLAASDKFGQEGEAYLKSMASKNGIEILAEESFDPNDTDMSVQWIKVAAAKPQAIVVWTIGPAGAMIAKNASQNASDIPLFQCHGQPDAAYIKLAGGTANGTAMPSTKLMVADQLPANDLQRNVVMDFAREFQQRKIGAMSTHSGYAWDAVQIVFQALNKAGTEPEALREAIEKTSGYVGVSGIYNLNATDHCGLDVSSLVIVKVENGQWKLVK